MNTSGRQRDARVHARQRIAGALLVVCFASLLLITLFPIAPNLSFLSPVSHLLVWAGVPHAVAGQVLEAILNVLMFVPLGLLLAFLMPSRRWWWLAVLTCAAVSFGVELIQAVALAGRSATLIDFVANSTGGAIGSLIALPWLPVREPRTANPAPARREPERDAG